ncbi:MAG TPA: hypothetical protein VK588_10665 [Chitinophagaceae bacterium]|nr:hypothetical protein [Chitinophagaceae bacterium]
MEEINDLRDDTLENPVNNKSENPPAEKSAVIQPDTISPNQEIENMEVHHHPHLKHNSKAWKEYLLEGLMIFLAVMLGFFAENLRENIGESHREQEFAKALYKELLDDSTVAATKLQLRLEKEVDMDYLNSYIRDSSLTNLPKNFYPAFTTSLYLFNTYTFEPKDGILNQLKNSGSLRYFKSIGLQKLLGDISVCINNMRSRNEQEYQYFASPLKPFLLKYFDFSWLDQLRKNDNSPAIDLINAYRKSNNFYQSKILNLALFNKEEASNTILFFKQMLISTRTLQLQSYIVTNHRILDELRKTYIL